MGGICYNVAAHLRRNMADIFISYATEDRERAKALAEALELRGWSVWWTGRSPSDNRSTGAPQTIEIGADDMLIRASAWLERPPFGVR